MAKLGVFNLVTLDGYVVGHGGDISWHTVDDEFQAYAERASNSGSTLLFGRVTYQLMAGYWPSAAALENDPVVAAGMNSASKIVFSRTLERADWSNTRLVREDMLGEVRRLKDGRGPDMRVLGSASIVAQLAQAGLVDEYQMLFNPIVLGSGRTMFEGLAERSRLRLTDTHVFGNGGVLLSLAPAGS